jgi:integrase
MIYLAKTLVGLIFMASFTNRGTKKKPSWQYVISRMVNGKSKPIRKGGFHSKKEAEAAAAEIESELRKGIVPQIDPIPFDEYFESWVKVFRSDVGENTMARYKDSINNVKKYFGSKPIQQISKTSYQSFLNDYAKDGDKAKATLKKINTHIRACARDAIDEGIIRVDFTRDAKFPGREGKPKEEKHLDYEESENLLNTLMDNPNKTLTQYLILLGLTSGMRYGEIVGLTRKDFDFVNNTININKTWGTLKKCIRVSVPQKTHNLYGKLK